MKNEVLKVLKKIAICQNKRYKDRFLSDREFVMEI